MSESKDAKQKKAKNKGKRKAPGLMSKFSKVFGRSKSFDRNKPTVFSVKVQHR